MACGVHDFDFDLRLFALCFRERLGTYQRNVRGISVGVGRRWHASAFGGDSVRGTVEHNDSVDALRRRRGSDSLRRGFCQSRQVVATRIHHGHGQLGYLARYRQSLVENYRALVN